MDGSLAYNFHKKGLQMVNMLIYNNICQKLLIIEKIKTKGAY